MLSIFSISLGCPKNRVDTERTLGQFKNLRPVATPAQADLVFINTCGFIAPAIDESITTIFEQIKEIETIKEKPLLIVGGCLIGRYGIAPLQEELPEVDLWLDSHNVSTWAQEIDAVLQKVKKIKKAEFSSYVRLISTDPSYAWLKISEGCKNACSFCTIPFIRGKKVLSTPKEALVAEAKLLLGAGVKELIIVAQDTTAWGKDLAEPQNLQNLMESLLPLSGLERLRLMYAYPAGLTKELLQFLQEAGAPFVPYFDIPLQHAAPNVLARMGRPFAHNPQAVIDRIRHFFPKAALRTSLIVGFPGETEEDFILLCDFVEKTRFHHLGVFAYEAEEGTPAATMPHQIPSKVKQERKNIIMEIQAEISEEILKQSVGHNMQILVDHPQGEWPGLHIGRTWFQAPEIDGVTYVSGKGVTPGSLVYADIEESSTYDLVALAEPEGE